MKHCAHILVDDTNIFHAVFTRFSVQIAGASEGVCSFGTIYENMDVHAERLWQCNSDCQQINLIEPYL